MELWLKFGNVLLSFWLGPKMAQNGQIKVLNVQMVQSG